MAISSSLPCSIAIIAVINFVMLATALLSCACFSNKILPVLSSIKTAFFADTGIDSIDCPTVGNKKNKKQKMIAKRKKWPIKFLLSNGYSLFYAPIKYI